MTRQERAKQFMPFDAMKGLQEALRDREERHLRSERRELSEEQAAELNAALSRLRTGQRVRLSCYYGFHDAVLEGRVTRLRPEERMLRIDELPLHFEDIYSLTVTDMK
ncbi:MAG: YolD-like family protein [Oscillospiraceae bacterium]|nr:YolD-like family protein [Oscillospiraceae bacterium]